MKSPNDAARNRGRSVTAAKVTGRCSAEPAAAPTVGIGRSHAAAIPGTETSDKPPIPATTALSPHRMTPWYAFGDLRWSVKWIKVSNLTVISSVRKPHHASARGLANGPASEPGEVDCWPMRHPIAGPALGLPTRPDEVQARGRAGVRGGFVADEGSEHAAGRGGVQRGDDIPPVSDRTQRQQPERIPHPMNSQIRARNVWRVARSDSRSRPSSAWLVTLPGSPTSRMSGVRVSLRPPIVSYGNMRHR